MSLSFIHSVFVLPTVLERQMSMRRPRQELIEQGVLKERSDNGRREKCVSVCVRVCLCVSVCVCVCVCVCLCFLIYNYILYQEYCTLKQNLCLGVFLFSKNAVNCFVFFYKMQNVFY